MNRVSSNEASITNRVRRARREAGLNQTQLAARIGLSKAGYSHYERGRQPFTVDQLFLLSRILGRSVEWFLGLDTKLTDDEDRLLTTYRGIESERLKRALLRSAEEMARTEME